jgi:hypothetical protein
MFMRENHRGIVNGGMKETEQHPSQEHPDAVAKFRTKK